MMQLWWNISIQWYSMDNGPPNHWCIMMCCFKYNGRIWHLPFSSHEASDVGRVVWRDQGVAGALQLGLQPSHLEFRQLEEDTRLHMAGVNGEITWGKPVCEHLMYDLVIWFMKACAEISHQGSVQRMFHRQAKKNRHQIIERSLSSPTSSGWFSFSRIVRGHSTCYGKAMKRTAFNSDSGLGVTFQLKNGRFLGLGWGMAKFASICPHVWLCMSTVWV